MTTNEPVVKRARPKRIRTAIGPFATACTSFDRGDRPIQIVRITPLAITYRLKGRAQEFTLPHETAFLKAVGLAANADTGPREGRIRRGS